MPLRHPVGVVAVGINDEAYQTRWVDRPAIRFAQADAEAFHAYVVRAWPSMRPEHAVLLPGAAATAVRIRKSVGVLASHATFDLFVLFLSGHGVSLESGGYYCTVDGVPEQPGLGPTDLHQILGAIQADRVLLVLDCCHAHLVVGGCAFFGALGKATARLYVCSSGGRERSWEDARTGQGLFTAALLAALDRGAPNAAAARLLQSELVPDVRRWVATAAQERGGVAQQPVSGGSARDDIALPLVSGSGVCWQPPTTTRALRRGVLRALRCTAASLFITSAICQVLTYHIATNRSGHLSVATGIPLLRAVWPSGLSERVDTGIARDSVRAEPVARWEVSEGRGGGLWMHRDVHGLRSWFDRLVPLLGDRARSRSLALVQGTAEPLQGDDSLEPVQPWQISNAIDAAIVAGTPVGDLLPFFPQAPLDFKDYDHEAFAWSSDALAGLAASATGLMALRPDEGAEALNRIRRVVAYRAARDGGFPAQEAFDVAHACRRAAAFGRGRAALGTMLPAMDSPYFTDAVLAAYCSSQAATALTEEERTKVAEVLLGRLLRYDVALQGSALTADQSWALHGLQALGAASRLTDTELQSIWDLGVPAAYERLPEVGEFLVHLADARKLPDTLRESLLRRVQDPDGEYDFFAARAATALAANARFVDAAERDAIGRTVLEYGARFERSLAAMTPGEADRIGRLGQAGVDVSRLEPSICSVVNRDWIPAAASTDYEVVATEIVWSDMPFAVALARLHRSAPAPDDVVTLLESVALLRPEAEGREHLVEFLAAQRDLQGAQTSAVSFRSALARYPRRAAMRKLEAEIAVRRGEQLDEARRALLVQTLRCRWTREREPEVRWGLAEIILGLSR